MTKGIAVIQYEECMACGCCVQACPFSFLALSKTGLDALNKEYPELINDHKCTGCGLCLAACPIDCISLQN